MFPPKMWEVLMIKTLKRQEKCRNSEIAVVVSLYGRLCFWRSVENQKSILFEAYVSTCETS